MMKMRRWWNELKLKRARLRIVWNFGKSYKTSTKIDKLILGFKYFFEFPMLFYTVSILIVGLSLFVSHFYYDISLGDVLVEIHGFLFDIIVLGVIFTIYQRSRDTKEKIERYQDEIDDYRGWNADEAMYRITGNIKRLVREKIHAIDLSNCFLEKATLNELDLKGSSFRNSNVKGANLSYSHLNNSDLGNSNFSKAALKRCSFSNTNLEGVNFNRTDLRGVDFTNANLKGAKFKKSNMDTLPEVKVTIPWIKNNVARKIESSYLNNVKFDNAEVDCLNWIEVLKKCKIKNWQYVIENYFVEEKNIWHSKKGNEIKYFIRRKKNQK